MLRKYFQIQVLPMELRNSCHASWLALLTLGTLIESKVEEMGDETNVFHLCFPAARAMRKNKKGALLKKFNYAREAFRICAQFPHFYGFAVRYLFLFQPRSPRVSAEIDLSKSACTSRPSHRGSLTPQSWKGPFSRLRLKWEIEFFRIWYLVNELL